MLAKKGQTNKWLSKQVSKDPVAVSKWCTNMAQPTLIGEDWKDSFTKLEIIIFSIIMASKEPGYVYILTNPSFREDWVKIGMSSRPVAQRVSELYNTSVPLPFDIYATMKTVKYTEAEKCRPNTGIVPKIGVTVKSEKKYAA